MSDDRNTSVPPGGRPERSPGLEVAPNVRRPDEHIKRARLRVKHRERRGAPAAAGVTVREAPETAAEAPPAESPEPATATAEPDRPEAEAEGGKPTAVPEPARHVPPPAGEDDPRFRYATYRSAPREEPAPRWSRLAALIRRDGGREISTGFVLGVALILAVLIGGIWLARLSNRVGVLEQRLTQLEGPVTTADAGEALP